MNDKSIVNTQLIPFKISDDIIQTVRSMRNGIKKTAFYKSEETQRNCEAVIYTQLMQHILLNWAISATAAAELDDRLTGLLDEYDALEAQAEGALDEAEHDTANAYRLAIKHISDLRNES